MTDRFVDRRILAARDLTNRYGSTSDLDGLHVRVAHGTWGIAEGLEVLPLDSGRIVVVSPGVGFDHCGTVMTLATESELAPPAPGPHQIVLTDCGVSAVPPNSLRGCPEVLVLATAIAEWADATTLRWTDVAAQSHVGAPARERVRPRGRRDLHQPQGPGGRDDHRGAVPDDAAVLLQRRGGRPRRPVP